MFNQNKISFRALNTIFVIAIALDMLETVTVESHCNSGDR